MQWGVCVCRTRVVEADDVAREGLLDGLSLLREQLLGLAQRDGLLHARVVHFHALLNHTTTSTERRGGERPGGERERAFSF